MIEDKIDEIKQKIIETKQVVSKAKSAEQKKKGEAIVDVLKKKAVGLITQKKQVSGLVNNEWQPPPTIKQVETNTEEIKTNEDVDEREVMFQFKLSE